MAKPTPRQLAERIANKLLFISGVNLAGSMLTPSVYEDPSHYDSRKIEGGSYCRSEVIDLIELELNKKA